MSVIPLKLPDVLRQFVDAGIRDGQFSSPTEYVAHVDAERSNRSEIETALLEGIHSGPTEEWTAQEWAEIKQRVTELKRTD